MGPQVYLTTLEAVKAVVSTSCSSRGVCGPAETAAIASSVGGGVASLTTQAIIVPVDVVGSRLDPIGSARLTTLCLVVCCTEITLRL